MRFCHTQHRFYCGIDLQARSIHVCVIDSAGVVVLDRKLRCHFDSLVQALAPFREDVVIGPAHRRA